MLERAGRNLSGRARNSVSVLQGRFLKDADSCCLDGADLGGRHESEDSSGSPVDEYASRKAVLVVSHTEGVVAGAAGLVTGDGKVVEKAPPTRHSRTGDLDFRGLPSSASPVCGRFDNFDCTFGSYHFCDWSLTGGVRNFLSIALRRYTCLVNGMARNTIHASPNDAFQLLGRDQSGVPPRDQPVQGHNDADSHPPNRPPGLANPRYAFDKLRAYREDTYLVNPNKVFDPVTGAYDKSGPEFTPRLVTEDSTRRLLMYQDS